MFRSTVYVVVLLVVDVVLAGGRFGESWGSETPFACPVA